MRIVLLVSRHLLLPGGQRVNEPRVTLMSPVAAAIEYLRRTTQFVRLQHELRIGDRCGAAIDHEDRRFTDDEHSRLTQRDTAVHRDRSFATREKSPGLRSMFDCRGSLPPTRSGPRGPPTSIAVVEPGHASAAFRARPSAAAETQVRHMRRRSTPAARSSARPTTPNAAPSRVLSQRPSPAGLSAA